MTGVGDWGVGKRGMTDRSLPPSAWDCGSSQAAQGSHHHGSTLSSGPENAAVGGPEFQAAIKSLPSGLQFAEGVKFTLAGGISEEAKLVTG